MRIFSLGLLALSHGLSEDRCTSILVGRDASGEGSPVTSHTVDCSACDFRLSKVKGQKYGSERPVYKYRAEYPRFLGPSKGKTYESAVPYYPWVASEGPFAPIGTIANPDDVVAFDYVDGAYGIMNEKGLSIGESTCGAVLTAKPVSEGGKALLDVRELSLIAMERCETARCAVSEMGAAAEKYGYYGADSSYIEAGEALNVVDKTEAWVFHVLADDTGSSAVWAAQRVQSDHVAVVANQFIIGEIPSKSNINAGFAYSSNIRDVAKRAGLLSVADQKGGFHFAKIFGTWRGAEMARYSTLRQWRVLSLAAPSLALQPPATEYDSLPFSVKAESAFPATRVIDTLRDHYEGTAFDMTKGPAAGPFGDPSRFDPGDNRKVFGETDGVNAVEATAYGRYERAISIFRCSYSFVSQPSHLPVFWVNQYAPHSGSYVPVYVGAPKVPDALSTGSLHAVDLNSQYWPHALVGNWASRFYVAAQPIVKETQKRVDAAVRSARIDFENKEGVVAESAMLAFQNETAEYERQAYIDLFFRLAATVKDGQILAGTDKETLAPQKIFYPRTWLERTGFYLTPNSHQQQKLWEMNAEDAQNFCLGIIDNIPLAKKLLASFSSGLFFAFVLYCCCCGCRSKSRTNDDSSAASSA